jgi:hydrogenase 3 maturation protease
MLDVLNQMSSLEELRHILGQSTDANTVIVCIGNILKGDDGAAIELYQKLAGKIKAELIDAGTVPENYIQRIIKVKPHTIVLIDAVDFGGSAGQIKIFEPEQIPEIVASTHVMSLRFFSDILKRETDSKIFLAGIQPEQLGLGNGLSKPVTEAVAQLSELFIEVFGLPS